MTKRGSRFEPLPMMMIVCATATVVSHCSDAVSADWPQILGTHRNGVASGEQILHQLPSKPPTIWRHRLGQGYAGPAIADATVYVFHRVGDTERLEALQLDTGKRRWQADFDATYRGGINPDVGPRCVPLVHQDKVIVFGAAGVAHAVDCQTGAKVWTRDLYGDFRANEGYFGAGSSPIAVGDRVLFNIGGRQGAGLVALSLATGETIWQTGDEGASYSSPTLANVKGKLAVVFVTRFNAVGIDAKNGRIVFRLPFGRRGPTVNAATPIVVDDCLFLTSSYQVGAALVDLRLPEKAIWSNDRSMSSQYNTPVAKNGYLYGIHGREDVGVAELRCVEAKTGRVVWSKAEFGVANLILVEDQLLAVTNDGMLVLIRAIPAKYDEIGRLRFSNNSTRALPALSDGRLLLRDNQGQVGELICLDIRP